MATINSAFSVRFQGLIEAPTQRQYQIKIYDKKWDGSGGVQDLKTTESGLNIIYDCEGDEKFAPIVGSKLSLGMVVDTVFHEEFIDDILGVSGAGYLPYNEGDVFITVNLFGGPTIWYGEYLHDLDTLPDMRIPFPVELTFTDGLGKLKEIEFKSENVDTTAESYRAMGHKTVSYWMGQILQHTKHFVCQANPGGFYDDASNKTAFKNTIRWYNTAMGSYGAPNQVFGNRDVWKLTKCTVKWADKTNPANGQRTIASAYEVLKQILRSWGARIIFWNGLYYITQIFEYHVEAVGANPNIKWQIPIDQYSQRYRADGTVYQNKTASIGNREYSRFDLKCANVSNPGERIQKLEGGIYKFLPVIKEVKTNLVHEGFQNIFPGWPFISNLGGNTTVPGVPQSYNLTEALINSDSYKFRTNWFVDITTPAGYWWLTQWSMGAVWGIIWAVNPAATVVQKDSAYGGPGPGIYAALSFNASNNSYSWDTSKPFSGNWNWNNWGPYIDLSLNQGPFPVGGTQTVALRNLNFPGFQAAATKYHFAIAGFPIPKVVNQLGVDISVATGSPYASLQDFVDMTNPVDGSAQNPPNWSTGYFNGNLSSVQPVATNQASTNTIFINTQTEDSKVLDWGDVFYSDGPEFYDDSALQVYNGSSWVFTDWNYGNWDRRNYTDITVPTQDSGYSFVDLLNHQIKQCQARTLRRTTMQITNSPTGTTNSIDNKPFYMNPVGVITDVDNDANNNQVGTRYYFRRGNFSITDDMWDGEWVEVTVGAIASSSQMLRQGGGGNYRTGTSNQRQMNQQTNSINLKTVILQCSENLVEDVAITSLDIIAPNLYQNAQAVYGTDYSLKSGDCVYLQTDHGSEYKLTLTADVASDATSISFESITPEYFTTYHPFIVMNYKDMFEQGNRKTRGTVAGFDVSATSLTKGGISIDGFLDSDTMEGASATKLATSESIKAYADTKQSALTLTTTGTSGASTLVGSTLNIPQYSGGSGTVALKSASVRPESAQSISSGGTVGSVSSYTDLTLNLAINTLVSPFSLASGNLRISSTGTYLVNFSFASTVSATANRTLAAAHLYKKLTSAESWTAVAGTQVYNYDRGTATSGGASTWGTVYEGSGASTAIVELTSLGEEESLELKIGFWIDGRASSASGITTIPDGCVLNVVKIK